MHSSSNNRSSSSSSSSSRNNSSSSNNSHYLVSMFADSRIMRFSLSVRNSDVTVLCFRHCYVHVLMFGLVLGLRHVMGLIFRYRDVVLFHFGLRDVVRFLHCLIHMLRHRNVVRYLGGGQV